MIISSVGKTVAEITLVARTDENAFKTLKSSRDYLGMWILFHGTEHAVLNEFEYT